jgi:hypothetical protein
MKDLNIKKFLFDLGFIAVSAAILISLNQYGLLEKNIEYSLIPILIAYYLGQYSSKLIKK